MPSLLIDFLLTLVFAFVVGLEFRRYLQRSQNKPITKPHFGSTRTLVLISLLGFVLYQLGSWPYSIGLVTVGVFLAIFYWRLSEKEHFSLLSLLIALLIYTIGPITNEFPNWFLILLVVTMILILDEKPLIHQLSEQLANEEIATLARFLVMSGVVLPLLPNEAIAPSLPVTYYKVWLAVIVVSGFSYLSYLVNNYFFKSRSLLITGLLAGLYSSTAATVVIAKRAHNGGERDYDVSAAVIMATTMMYLRLLVIVFVFDVDAGLLLLPIFSSSIIASCVVMFVLLKFHNTDSAIERSTAVSHPLELTTAILFAFLFVIFTFITQYITSHYGSNGLSFLAVIVGFVDIDPFILSLLSGQFTVSNQAIVSAVVLASGSNNLLKASYALAIARNKSVVISVAWLITLFLVTVMYIALHKG